MKAFITVILYQPLFNALMFLVWLIPGNSVGWAIITLTVILRLVLLPSSLKALRQQKRLQEFQPELQAIQEKYKDDRVKLSEELTRFYRVHKINPLSSCLPLILQLPILFVLYYVFKNGLDTSHFNLLYSWMPRPESVQALFFGINLSQPDRWILPIIAAGLQFIQGWQMIPKNQPKAKDNQQQMAQMISKQMMYFMPIFTLFIAAKLPSALPLYWAVTTLFGIGQQWWVYRSKKSTKMLEETEKTIKSVVKKGVEITVRKKK